MKYNCAAVLGSTGSIGTQALEVLDGYPEVSIAALAAGRDTPLFEQQIRKYRPSVAAVADENAARSLKIRIADTGTRVLSGIEGVMEAAAAPAADIVLNAVSGMAGLRPTLAALEAGKPIALANKEALVTGGEIVMPLAAKKGVPILPVDSEHSAVFQCLRAGAPREVKRLILTASGGPFFGRRHGELEDVTVEQTLRHPNWSMGAKITVDSATMMNKGLEIIEAMHLFSVPSERIDVVIHRQSVIHSMVEFCDNSVIAQMGVPDMELPIQYALTYPDRTDAVVEPLDLVKVGSLTFFEPDTEAFPCLALARRAAAKGGSLPVAMNEANETAVALFLAKKIGFNDIARLVGSAMDRHEARPIRDIDDIFAAAAEARAAVNERAGV